MENDGVGQERWPAAVRGAGRWARGLLVACLVFPGQCALSGCGGSGGPARAEDEPVPPDYLSELEWTDPRYHWREMPVRLRVDEKDAPPGYRPEFRQEVVRAAAAWAATGVVSIEVLSPEDPDVPQIVVLFYERDVLPGHAVHGGTQADHLPDGSLNYVAMALSVNVPGPMYLLALHEIGHALGIWGHSPYDSDIMHGTYRASRTGISRRDANTLRRLYALPARDMLLRGPPPAPPGAPAGIGAIRLRRPGVMDQHGRPGNAVPARRAGLPPSRLRPGGRGSRRAVCAPEGEAPTEPLPGAIGKDAA